MDYASIIKQKSEDLRDELKDLDHWQDEVLRQQEANKKRKVHVKGVSALPPIRGTVPSLKEAILKASDTCNLDREDPVKKFKEKGNELFQAGKVEEAIEAYSSGIDLDAEGAMAHVLYGNRALCHLKLELWERAEQDASSCLRLNQSYTKGYFRRAMARKQLRNLRGARADLEAVLALAPNDISATNEMKVITKMLQLERERAVPNVQRKKIFIAEVDDDDDDEENEGRGNEETVAPTNESKGKSFEMRRTEELHKEMQELESAREAHRCLQELRAREEEAKLSQKRRTYAHVEVIEEESEDVKKKEEEEEVTKKKKPESAVQNRNLEPATEVQKASPTASSNVSSKTAVSRLTEGDRNARHVAPRSFKVSSKWSQETLRVPNSFTEFERVFSDIGDNKDLCCYYVSLIPPASLRTLFGNNMTPDILLRLLHTVKQLPGTTATAFLKGLCAVKRVDDISLFFDSFEKKVVEEVIDLIVSCGAPQEDVNLFRQKLRVP